MLTVVENTDDIQRYHQIFRDNLLSFFKIEIPARVGYQGGTSPLKTVHYSENARCFLRKAT